jgi:DNA-binding GntR family transcriptional regulator
VKLLLSTSAFILEQLRNDIVSGRLAPGEPLRQDEIARFFNVSHVPIRETLLKLEAERLVEIRPRRGAIVANLSAAEFEELNEMRNALECCALRLAIPKTVDADLRKASQVLDLVDLLPERWAELNTEFHTVLYRPSERPRLLAEILSLQRNVERYVHQEVAVTNNFAASQREHRKLLSLIKNGRADEACSLLTHHILDPGLVLVSKLRRSGHD